VNSPLSLLSHLPVQQPIQPLHHPQSHLCNLRRIPPQTSRPKGKQSSADITCSYRQGRAGPTQRLCHLIKRASPPPRANRSGVAEQRTHSRAWCCSLSTSKPSRTIGGAAQRQGLFSACTINTMASQGELPAGWRPRMLSMAMNAAVVLPRLWFLDSAGLAGLKGLSLGPGCGFRLAGWTICLSLYSSFTSHRLCLSIQFSLFLPSFASP